MVKLFLPPMAMDAIFHVLTSFRVFSDVSGRSPVFSFGLLVLEQLWFPPEVLPIMSVNSISFMMVLSERTPFCLEVVHIEILIFRSFVD